MRRGKKQLAGLDDEIRQHIERETQDNIDHGMSPDEARRAALLKFGNVALAKEDTRAVWTVAWLDQLWRDLGFGLRLLRKSPGFAAVAILTLALGIGANTAIFSLIDAVMLRGLPVRDPQHLFLFEWRAQGWPQGEYSGFGDCPRVKYSSKPAIGCSFPLPIVNTLRAEPNLFSGLAAFAGPAGGLELRGNGLADTVSGEIVSGDYFSTLGVKAILGRTLAPSDDTPAAVPVVVLNYAFWQDAFGGNRSVIGRTIFLNKVAFSIVGVAEPSFTNLSPGKSQDLWLPIAMLPRLDIDWGSHIYEGAQNWWLVVLGRLKPGVSPVQAEAAATVVFGNQLRQAGRLQRRMVDPRIILTPAQHGLTGMRSLYSQELYIFMFAAGMILLIACANVAGLLVSRGQARQKEVALRLAIGAGRGRIVRQFLTESALLSLLGGVLGALIAYWGVQAITPFIARGSHGRFPFVVAPDWRVLCFALGATLLSGVFFGLAPALAGTRLDLTPALKENAPTRPTGAPRFGWLSLGYALVVAQVALGAVVLCGAGLLVHTLEKLRAINPGFDPHNVLLFKLDPTLLHYPPAHLEELYAQLRERLSSLPGVISASYSSEALLSGDLWTKTVAIGGTPAESDVEVDMFAVGPDFLRTMRIPLLEGRSFALKDFQLAAGSNGEGLASRPAPKTGEPRGTIPVLVNRAFARQYLASKKPLDAWISPSGGFSSQSGGVTASGPRPGDWQIVGVVGDTKNDNLRRAVHPAIYVPFTTGTAEFELRTLRDPMALASTIRQIVKQIDPNLPISEIRTQTEQIDQILWQERVYVRLSSFFALLAILLASIGLYGLLAYDVARRRREIGIRLALGAQRSDVMRQILRQGIIVAAIGAAAGIAVSLAVTRFLASLLYGVHPADLFTFAAVATLLFAVALAACWIPARRAMRVDPVVALRYE